MINLKIYILILIKLDTKIIYKKIIIIILIFISMLTIFNINFNVHFWVNEFWISIVFLVP